MITTPLDKHPQFNGSTHVDHDVNCANWSVYRTIGGGFISAWVDPAVGRSWVAMEGVLRDKRDASVNALCGYARASKNYWDSKGLSLPLDTWLGKSRIRWSD